MSGAIEFLQSQVQQNFAQTQRRRIEIANSAARRRLLAYGLKAISVFGGLAIAAGLRGRWAQGVGIAIAIAVATDVNLTANHARLLSELAASYAYQRLIRVIMHQYTTALAPLLSVKNADSAAFENGLTSLCKDTLDELHKRSDEIEDALAHRDVELLNRLSLEEPSPK